jgi:DNA-binding protein H-NS
MPIATPSRKWSYADHESHILTWRFTKRQVEMPYECWLLQAAGNCCTVRDLAEKQRESKLAEAKAAVLEEMKGKLSALGLTLNDVVPSRRPRKSKPPVSVKYRSPDGETWSGRGHAPLWLRQLELQGHKRDEFAVSEGSLSAE